MSIKKYVSLSKLSTFLDNLSNKFAALSHKHTISDISDYKVDSVLSSTSTNPVQNKVLDSEFEAMAVAMNALDLAIDGKADSGHNHNDIYYTETEIDTKLSGKSDTTHNHDSAYDAKGSAASVQENLDTVSNELATAITEISAEIDEETDIIDSQSGSSLHITDSADANLLGYTLYGKSVKDETAQTITSVGESGSVETQMTGENLFDADTNIVVNAGGTKKSDGTYTISAGNLFLATQPIAGNPNTQYTLSLEVTNATTDKITYIIFYYSDGTNDGYGKNYFNKVGKYIVTSQSGKTVTQVAFIYNDENLFTLKNIMLNEGSTALPYEPFKSQSYTHTLTDTLKGIGDVRDEIDFARGKRVARIGTLVLKGDESYWYATYSSTCYTYYDVNNATFDKIEPFTTNFQCSHFVPIGTTNVIGTVRSYGNALLFCYDGTNANMEAFKTYLAEQYANGTPLTVQYILAEPIETDIPDEEMAVFRSMRTYEGTTNISTDSFGDIEAEYVRNTELGRDVDRMLEARKSDIATKDGNGDIITDTYVRQDNGSNRALISTNVSDTALRVQSGFADASYIEYRDKDNKRLGFIGVKNDKPIFIGAATGEIIISNSDGQVIANASGQAPNTSLLRNSKLVSVETNPTVNGEIYWTYE